MSTKLNPGERIILVTRPHWLPVLFYPVVTFFILLTAMLEFAIPLRYAGYIFLAPGCFLAYRILQRIFQTWIVTTQRLIEERGLFTHIRSECYLSKINQLTAVQNIWGRIFGYGTVIIQTAAEHGAVIYHPVSNPVLMKETISFVQQEKRHFAPANKKEEFTEA